MKKNLRLEITDPIWDQPSEAFSAGINLWESWKAGDGGGDGGEGECCILGL